MPGKLTLHPPRRASRYLLIRDGETLVVGRHPGCGLTLDDPRVSKRHARLAWTGSGWTLDTAAESDRLARLQTSIAMRRRLGADLEPLDLLLRFLESAMSVVRAERGFVLVTGPDGVLRAEVATALSEDAFADERFAGSLGAVARAARTRIPIVVSDAQNDPLLSRRPSIHRKGIGALVCVPLLHEATLLGLLYVDSRKPGVAVSELDLEILTALAEHCALVIAAMKIDQRITRLFQRPDRHAAALEALTRGLGQRLLPPAGGPGA
jgi:GAF domain-containing protein